VPPPASSIADALRALATALDGAEVRWYVFGAQAAIAYGSTRVTKDIDVTVELPPDGVRVLVDALRAVAVAPRIDDVDDFIARTRVVPMVHRPTGMPIDVVLAGPGMEELFLSRARRLRMADVDVSVASPEDILVMKILAGRPHDREDALSVLRGRPDLDLAAVRSTLSALEGALDQSDLTPVLESLLARVGK
jgi:hypothetical protein